MRALSFALLSEFGIDYGSRKGRFNSLADDSQGDFNSYWWGETCRFEEFMVREFPNQEIFVSDHVPPYREFAIWPGDSPRLDRLCETALTYLEVSHPDASVVMASPLGFRLGCGRMVLTLKGAWVDQDLAFWLIEKSREKELCFPGLEGLEAGLAAVDVVSAVPWLEDLPTIKIKSHDFWRMVYTGAGLLPVGRTEEEEAEGYNLGYGIVGRLWSRYVSLNDNGSQDVAVSHSLPKHRMIKIECARELCDREFAENVFRVVTGFDGTWAIRFALFEDLAMDDSYLGGFLIRPDGQFVIEAS